MLVYNYSPIEAPLFICLSNGLLSLQVQVSLTWVGFHIKTGEKKTCRNNAIIVQLINGCNLIIVTLGSMNSLINFIMHQAQYIVQFQFYRIVQITVLESILVQYIHLKPFFLLSKNDLFTCRIVIKDDDKNLWDFSSVKFQEF